MTHSGAVYQPSGPAPFVLGLGAVGWIGPGSPRVARRRLLVWRKTNGGPTIAFGLVALLGPSDQPGPQPPPKSRERQPGGILGRLDGPEGAFRPKVLSEPQRAAWSPGGPEHSGGRPQPLTWPTAEAVRFGCGWLGEAENQQATACTYLPGTYYLI